MKMLGWIVILMLIVAIWWSIFYLQSDTRDPLRPSQPFQTAGRIATFVIWLFALAIFFMWLHNAMAADLKLRKRIIIPRPRPVTIEEMPIGVAPLPKDECAISNVDGKIAKCH